MLFRSTFLLLLIGTTLIAVAGSYSILLAIPIAVLVSLVFGLMAQPNRQKSDRSQPKVESKANENDQSDQLSTVMDSMVEAVIAVDNSERILFANPAAANVFDVDTERAVGKHIWEVIRNTTVQEVVRKALAGREQHAECELPRTRMTVSIVSTPLTGDPCPGVVLVLHDVTRLRQLEAMRRDFVSNVSHELKTPLTVIQACADTLLEGAIDDKEYNRTFLGRISNQSERLHRLILDLLQLARIESEEEVFEFTRVDLGDLIQDCLVKEESVAEGRGITLKQNETSAAGPMIIQGDPEAIQTMLGNLVENAIRYSPEGSEVLIACEKTGDEVRLTVSDNGPGIPSQYVDRIFERFYRVDRARSREMGGTGLGLAIVKHLTQIHGGRVQCESRLGEGSKFTITLPVDAEPQRHGLLKS